MLILGCPPGPRLDRRVDAAIGLFSRGLARHIVVSGAHEAAAGARRLVDAGVPVERVVVEPRARTTWENLLFSRPLLGPGPVWLVSEAWHLPRAAAMARRLGYIPRWAPSPEASGHVNHARALVREVGAWAVAAARRQVYWTVLAPSTRWAGSMPSCSSARDHTSSGGHSKMSSRVVGPTIHAPWM